MCADNGKKFHAVVNRGYARREGKEWKMMPRTKNKQGGREKPSNPTLREN